MMLPSVPVWVSMSAPTVQGSAPHIVSVSITPPYPGIATPYGQRTIKMMVSVPDTFFTLQPPEVQVAVSEQDVHDQYHAAISAMIE